MPSNPRQVPVFWCFLSTDISVYLYTEVIRFPPREILPAVLQSDAVRSLFKSDKHRTRSAAVVVCNAGISHEREAGRAPLGKPKEISDTASSFSHHK